MLGIMAKEEKTTIYLRRRQISEGTLRLMYVRNLDGGLWSLIDSWRRVSRSARHEITSNE
jgi:hypothetical protein